MASTTTLGTRMSSIAIGTNQEPFEPMVPASSASPLITSTSAVTTANLIGGHDIPAGTTGRCLYRQCTPGSTIKLWPIIGHATTPAAKTATLYLVHVEEVRPVGVSKAIGYKRTVACTLALTGAASGGNLSASWLSLLSDTLSGFATWAPCDITATSYLPGAGLEGLGVGYTPNNQVVTWDARGASFLEVWGVNGASSQGVAVLVSQC